MGSEINRDGKQVRPSFISHAPASKTWSHESVMSEMIESVRNVLEDVRHELKEINRTLGCHEFQAIPRRLRRISRNTFAAKNGREPNRHEM